MAMHNKKRTNFIPNGGANARPHTDPNTVLTAQNKGLEEMIKTYSSDTNTENLNKLVGMIAQARVLVPAKLNEKKMPMPLKLKNNEGNAFLPVFTSLEQIPPAMKQGAVLNATYLAMNEFALKDQDTSGIVINPLSNNLVFKRPLLEKIVEVEKLKKDAKDGKVKVPVKLTEAQYNTYERIKFEHSFLPQRYFEKKEEFIKELLEGREEYVDQLYEESYENKRMYPYLTEEFSITAMNVSEDVQAVCLEMPARDLVEKTCYRLYFIEDKANDKHAYFCIQKEKGHDELIEFKENGEHVLHGEAPGEGAELQTMLDLI